MVTTKKNYCLKNYLNENGTNTGWSLSETHLKRFRSIRKLSSHNILQSLIAKKPTKTSLLLKKISRNPYQVIFHVMLSATIPEQYTTNDVKGHFVARRQRQKCFYFVFFKTLRLWPILLIDNFYCLIHPPYLDVRYFKNIYLFKITMLDSATTHWAKTIHCHFRWTLFFSSHTQTISNVGLVHTAHQFHAAPYIVTHNDSLQYYHQYSIDTTLCLPEGPFFTWFACTIDWQF